MTIRFCFFCGTGWNQDSWNQDVVCTVCGTEFTPPKVIKESQLTLEESQSIFDKIPLTDKKAIFAAKRKKISSQTKT